MYTTERHGAPNRGNARMDTVIQVHSDKVYGVTRYYPANTLAENLAKALGQRTLTGKQLKTYKETGFTIEIVSLQHPDFLL